MGPPNGRFLLGPLDVDVDPLTVAGELGEAVDHVLGDLDLGSPVAELGRNRRGQRVNVIESIFSHGRRG